MSRPADVVGFLDMIVVGPAELGASYVAQGSPFAQKISKLMFANTLDQDVLVAFDLADGVTPTEDHMWLPAKTSVLLDLGTDSFLMKNGTSIYMKDGDAAPTTGKCRITLIYHA